MKKSINLTFKYQSANRSEILEIDESAKLANEEMIYKALVPYLEKLKIEECRVLVTVAENGKHFTNELVGCDMDISLN